MNLRNWELATAVISFLATAVINFLLLAASAWVWSQDWIRTDKLLGTLILVLIAQAVPPLQGKP